MSQGNENAQPTTPVDQPAQVTAPAETPPAPEPELTDPDLIELREAEAAAKVEEAAAQATGTEQASGTPAPAPVSATPTGQQQPPAAPAARVPVVPKPRFDQVLKERDEAREQAAYHRGIAEARAPAGQPASAQQQPTAQSPEQRLAGIATEVDALAKKFDDGEITMADFKKQERALTTREQAIREEALLAKVPQSKASGGDNALYLEDLTTKIIDQHPWVGVFDQVGSKSDWAYLEATARERLAERGTELAPGALGSATLRREMAAVADELGPVLLTARAQAQGLSLPGQTAPQPAPQPQPPAKAPLSSTAQNRLDKLVQQGSAPPNLSAMSGANGPAGITDAAIEAMTEDQFLALPAATQARILSRTSSAP